MKGTVMKSRCYEEEVFIVTINVVATQSRDVYGVFS